MEHARDVQKPANRDWAEVLKDWRLSRTRRRLRASAAPGTPWSR